jgi:polyhydroxybutyrate depolymerase
VTTRSLLIATTLLLAVVPAANFASEIETSLHVVETGTGPRAALLYVPESDAPVPLLIFMHGAGNTAGNALEYTGLLELAVKSKFAIAAPQALENAEGRTLWNAGGCCTGDTAESPADLDFLQALLDGLVARYAIDSRQIFLLGESNGGMLAYRASATLSPPVRGLAVVAAAMFAQQSQPGHPLEVLIVHGAADKAIPAAGGFSQDALVRSLQTDEFLSTSSAFEFWKSANACSGSEEAVEDRAVRVRATGCAAGSGVQLWELPGVGHGWPKNIGGRPTGEQLAQYLRIREAAP